MQMGYVDFGQAPLPLFLWTVKDLADERQELPVRDGVLCQSNLLYRDVGRWYYPQLRLKQIRKLSHSPCGYLACPIDAFLSPARAAQGRW